MRESDSGPFFANLFALWLELLRVFLGARVASSPVLSSSKQRLATARRKVEEKSISKNVVIAPLDLNNNINFTKIKCSKCFGVNQPFVI